ncbi:MAG: aminomethyl-transferring glycine dehydrogenase [Planctomycetes bacterium]|nr:aminomethyl-transferring glycine dehydrogenase [Planctomycetota bacterium]
MRAPAGPRHLTSPPATAMSKSQDAADTFARRHLGPSASEVKEMLRALGLASLEDLVDRVVPRDIRARGPLDLPGPRSESAVLAELRQIASRNQVFRSYLGLGYHGTFTPPVILRSILENPGWYTAYTPYQAEIAQGRLEMLLNYQTMVCDLTGLPVASASLLDEATAAAEAMALAHRVRPRTSEANVFFADKGCHPQTIAVVQTRAEPLGIEVVVGDHATYDFARPTFGCLVQYPATDGRVPDYGPFVARVHSAGALAAVATDLLALALLRPPGEFGADVALGNSQRFGVPMGYGGPHAAFFATRKAYLRQMPGRLIGVSVDAAGRPALRMALQTREQHIRREKATSNICTAEVLLAVTAAAYAIYHGPDGIRRIAERTNALAKTLAAALARQGHTVADGPFFDTIRVRPTGTAEARVLEAARARRINLRGMGDGSVVVALDETVTPADVADVAAAFGVPGTALDGPAGATRTGFAPPHARTSSYLEHPVFNSYHSETEMLRYLHRLQAKDLTLDTSMIPLGSCTMKLNATVEMMPVTWPEFGALHPFAPAEQAEGYRRIFSDLERWLAQITGFDAVSLQPNAGSQGEYAGLLVLRRYHRERGEGHRDVCLIPASAHGTNPASATMAGLAVHSVACDDAGNVDLADLAKKADLSRERLAALMVTYPSTHGVFEERIREICEIVHRHGGQVYMDGANMNAQVGLCRPGDFGPDLCHLNLHKTFSIPHGGGGPGVGPIAVKGHLAPFLPGHPLAQVGGKKAIGPVSGAPWGSASILPISWAYIALMGAEGLAQASRVAILAANYVARRLHERYPVLYRGVNGFVAHECILDTRPFKTAAGVEVDDIAKRLMDYGFHAPTMSFPVPGTLMVEPTESESRRELDRFCDALVSICEEIGKIGRGEIDREDNPLKNAPHTADMVSSSEWTHPYTRERAAYPALWTREHKYWPPVRRIDNVHGDRNPICTCPSVIEMASEA